MYLKDALIIILQDPVHAKSELLHHLNVVEDSHDFPAARTANTGEEALCSHPIRQPEDIQCGIPAEDNTTAVSPNKGFCDEIGI